MQLLLCVVVSASVMSSKTSAPNHQPLPSPGKGQFSSSIGSFVWKESSPAISGMA